MPPFHLVAKKAKKEKIYKQNRALGPTVSQNTIQFCLAKKFSCFPFGETAGCRAQKAHWSEKKGKLFYKIIFHLAEGTRKWTQAHSVEWQHNFHSISLVVD